MPREAIWAVTRETSSGEKSWPRTSSISLLPAYRDHQRRVMTMMTTREPASMRWLGVSPASCSLIFCACALRKSIRPPSVAFGFLYEHGHAPVTSCRGRSVPPKVRARLRRWGKPHPTFLDRDVLDLLVSVHELGPDGEQGLEGQVGLLHRGHDAGDVLRLLR